MKIKRLRPEAVTPYYATANAAGFDLAAAASATLDPGCRALVPTGWAVEVPEGFELQVRPRSGWAHKYGVTVLNAPGTVDADYRGEVCVLLYNSGDRQVQVMPGDRIAQGVVCPVATVALVESETLSDTERAENGFGSTGDK